MLTSTTLSLLLAADPTAEAVQGSGTIAVGDGKDRVYAPLPPSVEEVADINRVWRGLGMGYSNGLFGRSYAQSVRIDVPFGRRIGQFMGARLEGRLIHPPVNTPGPYDPAFTSGLMLFGRTPVWQGRFRVYGGAGTWVGIRPDPTDVGEQLRLAGGGFFGTEFMLNRRTSFTFEVGGQSPGHDGREDDGGASVMGGVTVYLGAIGKRHRK